MAKVIKCPSGKWTRLVDNLASGMPATWTIDFSAPSGEVSGKARQFRSFLPLGIGLSLAGEDSLRPRMEFQRYWSNASYRLEVCPDQDVVATFRC